MSKKFYLFVVLAETTALCVAYSYFICVTNRYANNMKGNQEENPEPAEEKPAEDKPAEGEAPKEEEAPKADEAKEQANPPDVEM